MTLQKSAPHAKPRWLALLGTVTLLAGLLAGNAAAASTATSVTDYSQCPNGTSHSLACLSTGWINGILNAQNSSYREDQVTPQRTLLVFPAGDFVTGHRIDITYLTRKGGDVKGVHAYDSLATWNDTETAANRCQLLTNCPSDSPLKQFAFPSDSTVVAPFANGASGVTSAHELPNPDVRRQGYFYGPVSAATASTPTHTCPSGTGCTSSDDYATVQISFDLDATVVDTDHNDKVDSTTYVQLVFGGHLAAGGFAPTSPRGWGTGLGASDINGGPYHIRITNIDAGSIGNRDNQIASSAILPLATPGFSTLPSATTSFSATLDDSATMTGGSSPTGSLVFKLYASLSDCTNDANVLYTDTVTVAGNATYSTTTGTASGNKVVSVAGTYYWGVSYSGDDNNIAVAAACDETESVTGSSVSS